MQNPAESLHRIFSHWQKGNPGRNLTLDQLTEISTPKGADDVVHVFRLLHALKEKLDWLERSGGPDISIYQKTYPSWVRIAAGYHRGWGNASSGTQLVPEVDLTLLLTLSLYLNDKVFEPTPDMISHLPDVLREARDLVTEADDLEPRLARYLHEIIREAEAALLNSKLGEVFDFEAALMRLYAGFQAAGLHTKAPSRKERFAKLAQSVFSFVVTTTAHAFITAGTNYGMGMLTTGGEE